MPAGPAAFASEHGCQAHDSFDALLADPAVQLVVNLTVHHAHYAVTKRVLEADRHDVSRQKVYGAGTQINEVAQRAGTTTKAVRFYYGVSWTPSGPLGPGSTSSGIWSSAHRPRIRTTQVAMAAFRSQFQFNVTGTLAGATIVMAVPMLVFLILQWQIIAGLVGSSSR